MTTNKILSYPILWQCFDMLRGVSYVCIYLKEHMHRKADGQSYNGDPAWLEPKMLPSDSERLDELEKGQSQLAT